MAIASVESGVTEGVLAGNGGQLPGFQLTYEFNY